MIILWECLDITIDRVWSFISMIYIDILSVCIHNHDIKRIKLMLKVIRRKFSTNVSFTHPKECCIFPSLDVLISLFQ